MKLPLDLRFIGVTPSDAVKDTVQTRIDSLERICPDATGWRVTVEQEHKHQQQGRPFAVRVDVTMPGQEVAVSRVHDEDVYVALREAFDAARRKIEEVVRIRRGEVKRHAA